MAGHPARSAATKFMLGFKRSNWGDANQCRGLAPQRPSARVLFNRPPPAGRSTVVDPPPIGSPLSGPNVFPCMPKRYTAACRRHPTSCHQQPSLPAWLHVTRWSAELRAIPTYLPTCRLGSAGYLIRDRRSRRWVGVHWVPGHAPPAVVPFPDMKCMPQCRGAFRG
jgi:hypothetical protein